MTGETIACLVEDRCKRGPSQGSAVGFVPRCSDCRLAAAGGGSATLFDPIARGDQHPVLREEKRKSKDVKKKARDDERNNKDKARQAVGRAAERSERDAERAARRTGVDIRATRNSGRSHRDGDYVVSGQQERITLDNKLQTNRLDPIVHLGQLDKVRGDADRAGAAVGALVLTNRHGRRVLVFDYEDLKYAVDVLQQ